MKLGTGTGSLIPKSPPNHPPCTARATTPPNALTSNEESSEPDQTFEGVLACLRGMSTGPRLFDPNEVRQVRERNQAEVEIEVSGSNG